MRDTSKACVLALVILTTTVWAAPPSIFWASDPVGPDETVLVCGDGFGQTPTVELAALSQEATAGPPGKLTFPDSGQRVEALQPSDQSLKFVIPADWQPGAYAFRIIGAEGQSDWHSLNAPTVYWGQGDNGTAASPGGRLRLFGRCISHGNTGARVWLTREGEQSVQLEIEQATPWSLTARSPDSLAEGQWLARVHNGCVADRYGTAITLAKPESWPEKVFNVQDFGALGDSTAGDGNAIRLALKEAEKAGGGVVFLPRGMYHVTGPLSIPRYTVLRGEATHLVSLFWSDTETPHNLIEGTDHFGVEDLTLHCTNYIHGIAAEVGKDTSGHTFLRRVRVRADLYRGHLKQEEVAERFRTAMGLSTGGGDIVRFGGPNIEISDCDLYGSGRSLYLLRPRGGRVTGNTFYNGRWGWYCIDGSDGLIFENNRILSADLMSTGGSLNCYSSAYSQNVWYAHNRIERAHGWDREAMTSDAGYGAYYGSAAEITPDTLTLAEDPDWRRKADWTGAGVFILGGKGMGQYRIIAAYDGRTVTLNRPWDVLPDQRSLITITMLQRQYLFIGNEFEDVGIALQYYGTSIDHVAADNKCTRGGGFYNSGRWYRHFQPSWYCQFIGNEILEGNNYRFGPNNATGAGASFLGTQGLQAQGGTAPLALCNVHRRNHLHNNAELRFLGVNKEHPGLRDLVAEHNLVENAARGVYMDSGCTGVLLRKNRFNNVQLEQVSDEDIARILREKRAALLDQPDPVVYFSFDKPVESSAGDDSGHNFWARGNGRIEFGPGVSGKAPIFDGDSYLTVADRQMLQFPRITLSAWVMPRQVEGRWGVMAKRSRGGTAPYVLAIREGGISFEGTDTSDKWSYNFTTRPVLQAGQWCHIAAVCEEGVGIKVYCNGQLVGEKKVDQPLVQTTDILTIGYENWGGIPPKAGQSGNFHGMIDEVKIWSRLLSDQAIKAEYEALSEQARAADKRRADEAARQAELARRFREEIVAAGGIQWTLVKVDDFEREAIGPDWLTLRGKWSIEDGILRCSETSFLGYAAAKVAARCASSMTPARTTPAT